MRNKQAVEFEIDLVKTIGDLVQTYEEIYVTKMHKVRDSVVGSRYFYEGLSQIYSELKIIYRNELDEMLKLRSKKNIWDLLNKKDQEVVVLLSASDKLSGEINQKVFQSFWDYIQQNDEVDIVIAGKLGKKFIEQKVTNRKYEYFDLPEKILGINDMKPLLEFLEKYRKVKVFYGKFQSFAYQKETVTEVTGEINKSVKPNAEKGIKKYLFEPDLNELLEFFETQIFNVLFQQTTNESFLSQIGSRVMSLESTTSRIEEQLGKLVVEERKLRKRARNKRQLQSLASISFWGKR